MAPGSPPYAEQNVFKIAITTARTVRACANGASSLIVARWLSALRYTDSEVAYFAIVLLVGNFIRISVLDSIASRNHAVASILDSVLMVAVGTMFAALLDGWTLWTVAMIGVVDVGILGRPAIGISSWRITTHKDANNSIPTGLLSYFLVPEFVGRIAGALTCGLVVQALQSNGWTQFAGYCIVWWLFAAAGMSNGLLYVIPLATHPRKSYSEDMLGNDVDLGRDALGNADSLLDSSNERSEDGQIPSATLSARLFQNGLCFLDSVAGGMLAISLVSLFLEKRYSLLDYQLGLIAALLPLVNAFAILWAPSLLRLLPSFRNSTTGTRDRADNFFPKVGSWSSVGKLEQKEISQIARIAEVVGHCIGVFLTGALAGTSHFGMAFIVGLMAKIAGLFIRSYIDLSSQQ